MDQALTPAGRALRLAGHICRVGLGYIFLASGALKSLDPEGFSGEVAQYGLLSGAFARSFAYLLIPIEVAVGAALLLNFRPALTLSAATALMVVFIGAIGYALATDQPLHGCGCFGRFVVRTPVETLREDLAFLAAGLIGLFALRGVPGRGRFRSTMVAAVALASGAFVIASPHLPLDDVATGVKPGAEWRDLGVALADVDLTRGAYLIALLGMKDEASGAALGTLNKLAESGAVPILGLHGDDDEAYNEFFWSRGPAFPIYKVAPTDMKRMHRKLPRFFAVKDGRVVATWETIPSAGEAQAALR
ncbi:MAG TPA: MauE/DoxX family redox-associated membrane protein [Candidatus Polarisedimenticolia bacterium]|jgi:uncharacterized membrane protein YphA (DoxX/SURF4 family)